MGIIFIFAPMGKTNNSLKELLQQALHSCYGITTETLEVQQTRKEFDGDVTLVVFPFVGQLKQRPEAIGETLGDYLKANSTLITNYNVVKGFLNLELADQYYIDFLNSILAEPHYGHQAPAANAPLVLVEYSSPNTNKPLHLGHIRNNVLGYAVAQILEASGKRVHKTQIVNDRGIHICKSMVAWQRYGDGATPQSTGLKGDQLVGNFYVKFDQVYKEEMKALIAKGHSEEEAAQQAPIFLAAQELLRRWEANDEDVRGLWKKMNGWVYDGFATTYTTLGVAFDSYYYESDTYLLGKSIIAEGLEKGLFFKKPDGSVWVDLTEEGLDEKLLLRSDGTAVYMTQDLGTATQRFSDHPDMNGMVYTVGNEQDYHFKVLFLILKKLGYSWAARLYHLSYGMVDLPSGKMKSREGTVVDADQLMEDMAKTAQTLAETHGKLEGMETEAQQQLFHQIGLGALKYFILKVDPKKRILFDPEASVDFNGNTGPFIQYTHARIQSILRQATTPQAPLQITEALEPKEKAVLQQLLLYPDTVQQAAKAYSPALIANYLYDLVKTFNSFYQNISILGVIDQKQKAFRVALTQKVGDTIRNASGLLGIAAPNQM